MADRQDSLRVDRPTRRQLELAWCVVAFSYCCLRVYLAHRFIGAHLDVRAFAIIEFAALVPETLGTCRLVGALVDHDTPLAARWALVAGGGFIAPDVFVLATARHAPAWLYLVVGLWLAGAAVLSLRHLNATITARRRERVTV